jgi:hypothetical protein
MNLQFDLQHISLHIKGKQVMILHFPGPISVQMFGPLEKFKFNTLSVRDVETK